MRIKSEMYDVNFSTSFDILVKKEEHTIISVSHEPLGILHLDSLKVKPPS